MEPEEIFRKLLQSTYTMRDMQKGKSFTKQNVEDIMINWEIPEIRRFRAKISAVAESPTTKESMDKQNETPKSSGGN